MNPTRAKRQQCVLFFLGPDQMNHTSTTIQLPFLVCHCLQRRQVLTWQLPRQHGRQTKVSRVINPLNYHIKTGFQMTAKSLIYKGNF